MSSTSSVTASGALGLYSKEAVKPSPDIAKKYSTASKVVSGIPLIGHWFSYSKHYDLGDDLIRETKLCRQIELLNLECEYSFIDIGRSLLTVALGTAGLALAFFIGPLSIAFAGIGIGFAIVNIIFSAKQIYDAKKIIEKISQQQSMA